MTAPGKVLRTQTFIGSSSESLFVANAIKSNLLDVTDCQVWTEGVFLPGKTFIETLETVLERMDYAIIVATPDDMLRQREVETFSMRDNVLLELGLFMAKLGRARTYVVAPRDKPLHIPSDLLGVTTADYDSPASVEAAAEVLKDACEKIRRAMGEAEKEVSFAMRRILVKRLLTLTNRIQGFLVTLQSESVRSLLDRPAFERIRTECTNQLAALAAEYEEDAARLGVKSVADQLKKTVLEAVGDLPYPEEAVVTREDVVAGLLGHLTGRRSVEEQVRDRFGKLATRYDEWWRQHGPRVSGALNEFQGALIGAL
jgi:hypothetical protein